MSCLWCFLSVFLSTLTIINSQGYYAIIAPNIIRPNSEYHVAVSIHKSSEPSSVKIGIISSSYSDFKTVEVRPYSTELVQFEFKDLKPEKYSLTAEGITGVIFTNETKLRFQPKQLSVLIQTDKSIYKPEDKVRFRVLILDSNLKPAKDYGQINVNVRDADKNRIIHLTDISLTSSIYSEEFELASSPVLGEWTIQVEAMGEMYTKTFEVLEYIRPNFEVSIETKKHAVYKDGTISATVRAKYPFGKPIKGEATVSIYPIFNGSLQPFITNLITRKVVPINGKAFVEFEIVDELKFNEDYQRDIIIEATVEEKLTGQKQNTTTIVTIHGDRYTIEIVRMPLYYIPNVPFDVTIKMVQHDGAPLKDDINPITAYLTRSYSSEEMYNKTDYRLDSNGMAKLNFMVGDEDNDVSHALIISYLGTTTDIGTVFRKHHKNDVFVQAELLTENPSVNEEVSVAVKSNQKMKYFIYQIIGRGDVLLSKAVDVPDSNYQTFKFLATFAMVPKARLLVHFVQDGDFIYDEQTIDFGDELANNINLESPNRVSPGQDVDITITTKPYCYIGLLAIDQRAYDLRSGHDITTSTVLDELMKYDSETPRLGPGGAPGQDAGLVTLTNTDYHSDMSIAQSTPSTSDEDDGKITTAKKTDIGPAHTFEVNTRPPLAGPYAFSRIPKPLWTRPRINVMTEIMDTWLFMNISSGKEGRTTVHKKIPNGMTSWMLTGFSLDPVTGLGISKMAKTIQVFQPFYITTDLPYSIKLGEIVSISFIVFNNMDKDLDVKVTLFNTAQEFDFIQVNNQVDDSPKIELYNRRLLNIPENSEKSVSFIIRPKKLGPIEIKASADSPVASDTVQKLLLVEPEGATEYLYEGLLIDLRTKPDQQDNVTLEIPRNVIPDSVHIEVSVVGDIIGPSVLNLDNLIRLPYACGEQNIAHFVPNVLVLRYLEKLGRLSPAVEAMAMKHLELGYQQTLSYKRRGGSFSVFGNLDKNGSTWLTAYVAKSFRQAAEFTEIDEEIIKIGLSYLARMQAPNGSFLESAQPIHDYFSYEIDGGISLTAFTVLAFLENANNIADYRNTINKALDFIVRGLDSSENVFSLAIGVYALQVAGHNAKDVFIPKLDAKAHNENGKKWWELEVPESDRRSPWYNNSRTLNIEATSYVALAYLKNNLVSDTFPIIKWLIDQRNINGGFASSYDTVVGLEALVEFSEKLTPTANNNIQVVFGYSQDEEYRINVHQDNTLAILSKEIPSLTRDIKVISSGRGIALAQVAYRYNTNVTLAWPRFTLDPQVNRISRDSTDYLQLSICTSYTPAVGEDEKSNMAVMEVGFPSGFTVDLDTIPSLESKERIMKVETKKRNTKVIIYFDFLNRTEICPTIDAYKTHKVTKHKQASVIIYDYYDNTRKARMFYYAPKSTLCDICEPDTCSDSCKERAEERSQLNGDADNGSGYWLAPSICVLLISTIIVKILP